MSNRLKEDELESLWLATFVAQRKLLYVFDCNSVSIHDINHGMDPTLNLPHSNCPSCAQIFIHSFIRLEGTQSQHFFDTFNHD
jgi:hypothetical protein